MSARCTTPSRAMVGVFVVAAALPATAAERQRVSFRAADGMRLAADYFPQPTSGSSSVPIAILLHGHLRDRSSWQPLIEPLHKAGFAILAIDLRGHGDSGTTETREQAHQREAPLFQEMQADVRGAYDWLARQPGVDRARFALVGADLGSSLALQYAARDRSVDALVCLSPMLNDFGLDAAGEIHQITGRRILLVATEDQRDAPYTLRDRTTGAEVVVQTGDAGHGTEMLTANSDLAAKIVRFLRSGIGTATQTTVYGSIKSNIYHSPDSGWLKLIAQTNMRYYSSPAEAESRGLRASRSSGPADGSRDRAARRQRSTRG